MGVSGGGLSARSFGRKVPPVTQDHPSDKDTTAGPLPGSKRARPGQAPHRLGGLRRHRRAHPGLRRVGSRLDGLAGGRLHQPAERTDAQRRLGLRPGRLGLRGLRAVAGRQPLRPDHAGRRGRGAGVPDRVLGGHDVQRRHGHRPDVLGRERAARALRHPPPGTAPEDSGDRMATAMATTLFHWTLHPWAIYAVVGLAIAYSTFRPAADRQRRVHPAHRREARQRRRRLVIDVLAIIATVFGSAASSAWVRCRSAPASRSSTGWRRSAPACWSPSSPC